MADDLAKLPTDNTPATPEEVSIIESLLEMTGDSTGSGGNRTTLLKATLILTALFAVLASPCVSSLIRKIPYLGNSAVALVVQTVVFLILAGLSLWFLSR